MCNLLFSQYCIIVMTWTRRCNVLLIIAPHSYHTRYQHFPYLLMVAVKPNQNASPEAKQGSFIGGVSTAPSLATDCTYTRGARYSYEGRVIRVIQTIPSLCVLTAVQIMSELYLSYRGILVRCN